MGVVSGGEHWNSKKMADNFQFKWTNVYEQSQKQIKIIYVFFGYPNIRTESTWCKLE
jgi:hypothetical protein